MQWRGVVLLAREGPSAVLACEGFRPRVPPQMTIKMLSSLKQVAAKRTAQGLGRIIHRPLLQTTASVMFATMLTFPEPVRRSYLLRI
jgi:hypothetical protein